MKGAKVLGKFLSVILIASSAAMLSACGGGNSGGSGSSQTNASPGGIWRGTDSVTGLQVLGIIDELGDFHFIRADNVQFVGSASTSGNSLSATLQGYAPLGSTFSDGSTYGSGSVSGTVQQRSLINSTVTFTTNSGNTTHSTLDLTFDTLYDHASSLTTVSGNFTNPVTGVVVTVNSDGSVFSQDPSSGCVLNGTVSIINASYNAYKVQFTYSNCGGQAAVLNGIQFSGLATLNTNASPAQAIVGVTGQSGGVTYALVFALNRS